MWKIELSPRTIRILSAVILTAVFFIGAAAGAAGWHWMIGPQIGPPPPHFGNKPFHDLDLTPEQMDKFKKINEKYRPQIDMIIESSLPKIRPIKEKMDAELRKILAPSQQKLFDRRMARRPRLPPRFRDRHGGPPGFHGPHEPPPPGFGDRLDVPPESNASQ